MKTLVLKVSLKEEEDGRWSASIPSLHGCSSWGYSKQEALENIRLIRVRAPIILNPIAEIWPTDVPLNAMLLSVTGAYTGSATIR